VLATVFLEGAIVLGVFAYVSSHLHDHFGLRFDQVGLILAVFGIGGLMFPLTSSFLVRTLGESGLVQTGGVLIACSMLAAALLDSVTPFFAIAAVMGFGFTMLHNTLQTRATQMAPANRGSAVSLFASMFFLGQMTGVAIAGWSYDQWGAIPGFAASAVFTPLLAAAFALYLGRTKSQD
jgi:predicted MFS family arabinose efflux permease